MHVEIPFAEPLGVDLAEGRRGVSAGVTRTEVMRGGGVDAGARRQRIVAQITKVQAAAPGTQIREIESERAGRERRVRNVFAQVAGSVIEGLREMRVISRVASVELEPARDLVGHVDFVAVAAGRRAPRTLGPLPGGD